eukprot:10897-Heterococcus_DN1.PRE.1
MPPLPPRQQQQLHKPAHFHQLSQGHYQEFAPRIVVIGVGGAGGNAVNNMIARNLHGVEFLVCNTDAQHLSTCLTENRLQLGKSSGEVRVSYQVYSSSLSMPYKLAQTRQCLHSALKIVSSDSVSGSGTRTCIGLSSACNAVVAASTAC